MANAEDTAQPSDVPQSATSPESHSVPPAAPVAQSGRPATRGSLWYFIVSIAALFLAPGSIFAAFNAQHNHTTPPFFIITAIAYIAGIPLLLIGVAQLRRAMKQKLSTPLWIAGIIFSSMLTAQLILVVGLLILALIGLQSYNGG